MKAQPIYLVPEKAEELDDLSAEAAAGVAA